MTAVVIRTTTASIGGACFCFEQCARVFLLIMGVAAQE